MGEKEHLKNQVLYITNPAYDALHSTSDVSNDLSEPYIINNRNQSDET
ncbi:hypothetical protein [Bacillus sp. Marseille-P3661]|nr:hypothetical protein [Bacillus sp. Marseille-P3661]